MNRVPINTDGGGLPDASRPGITRWAGRISQERYWVRGTVLPRPL